jgi:hypothetical protein
MADKRTPEEMHEQMLLWMDEGVSDKEIGLRCAAWLGSSSVEEMEAEMEELRVFQAAEARYLESLKLTKLEPLKRCEHRRQRQR